MRMSAARVERHLGMTEAVRFTASSAPAGTRSPFGRRRASGMRSQVDERLGNEVRNATIGSRGSGPRGAAGRTTGGRLVSEMGWSPASAIRSSVV
jgi:hypothetical protein